MKSELAKARDNWLMSDNGKKCCEGQASGQFLQNRLVRAFLAGANFSSERIKELEAVFEKYAKHTYECGLRFDHESEIHPCDCGFEQALKKGK